MSDRKIHNRALASVTRAARCAIEALEQRVHLSYGGRGKVSVIVEAGVASQLTDELAQLQQDLIADGWTVAMHTNAPLMIDDENVWDNEDLINGPHAVESHRKGDIHRFRKLVTEKVTEKVTSTVSRKLVLSKTNVTSDHRKGDIHRF
jgi:hypothetical protein